MENFPKYYTRLFNGVTDALRELQKGNPVGAEILLIRAQQDAEELFLADGDAEKE